MPTGSSRSSSARLAIVIAVLATCARPAAVAAADSPPPDASVRGVIRAVQQALISTELAVRVASISVREGEEFKAGEKLLEFDCRRQQATVAAADAQQLEMQLTVDKNRLLSKTQSVGKLDLDVSEARLAKAKAEADALRSQLEQCVVIAPFDGRVSELSLQVHETSQPGKAFIGLVANTQLEIDLIVSSQWVSRLAPGSRFTFWIDELQRRVEATIARMGAAVDPVSQTIKVIARFDNADRAVLPGMSGTAELPASGK